MKLKYINTIISMLAVISGLVSCIDDPDFSTTVHNAGKPEVGELTIVDKDKTASTVVLKSEILKANGYKVYERGFIWNTDTVRPPHNNENWLKEGEGIGEFTDTIKNLKPGVLYYFWSYAKNERGEGFSAIDSTRTTDGLGDLVTYVPDEYRRATSAIVSGKIRNKGDGQTVSRGAYYSKSANLENKLTKESETPFELDSFVCEITGLNIETEYFTQVYITNNVSDTLITTLGDIVRFRTGDGKPEVDTIVIREIGYTQIRVASKIISIGDIQLQESGFCWGTNPNPTKENGEHYIFNSHQPGEIVYNIENLLPQQEYYVCAYAQNEFGITYGVSKSFFTKSDIPTLQTVSAENNYREGKVYFNGLIVDEGKSDIISKGFCYSSAVQNPRLTNSTVVLITSPDDHFSTSISGLRGGTRYYVCAFASNAEGTSYGEVLEFTTPAVLSPVSNVPESFSNRLTGSSSYFMIGNRGYILGGDKGSDYTNELWRYNGITMSWQDLAPYTNGPAKWQAVAVYRNNAYVLGGISPNNVYLNDFRQYNTSDNLWHALSLTDGPDPAHSRVGFTHGSAVYYVGGKNEVSVKNEVWTYQFLPHKWMQRSDFPVSQYGGIAFNIDGEVYVGLGKDEQEICNGTIWKANNDFSVWTVESQSYNLINGGVLVSAYYNGKIYIVDEAFYIHEYDVTSRTWKVKSQISAGDQDIHCMFVMSDVIYVGLINKSLYIYNPLWDN